jgi:hypothetical protein
MLLCLTPLLVSHLFAVASIDMGKVLKVFTPQLAFGAGVDGQEKGDIERSFQPHNVEMMLNAGLRSLTYRLRTELGVEAFHWNPAGTWSDAQDHCGYWTSNATSSTPILKCYGYHLPRRGNTIDQANNDGYSRLDDGDPHTFWKSNPYLDPAYTGEADSANPQWVIVDLGRPRNLNSLRIEWGRPYATNFAIEYWKGSNEVGYGQDGAWRMARAPILHCTGGIETVPVACDGPVRFVRLKLLMSSHTAIPSAHPDARDSMGFSICEIALGWQQSGRFTDWIKHRPNKKQSVCYTSSTDPWHRDSDEDPRTEQPGFDLVAGSGLTNGMPLLMAAPVLYDNPANAAAEVAYLLNRGVRLRGVELGEEPDGQCASAEHYGALYLQFAKAIRKVAPDVAIGGPSFQSPEIDYIEWPEQAQHNQWIQRFRNYLALHNGASFFQFLSFEWYPFDELTEDVQLQLLNGPKMLRAALERVSRGIGRQIPVFITEYGYSAFAGPQEDDLPGAISNLDIVGTFLPRGDAAFLYGYEPNTPISEKDDLWGNLMMIEAGDNDLGKYYLPTYYAAKMLTGDFCANPTMVHSLLRVELNGTGSKWLSAYAVRRPNGSVALLLLNKSRQHSISCHVEVNRQEWSAMTVVQYSSKDYSWHRDGENSHPSRSSPPERFESGSNIGLPPYSITVVSALN